VDEASHERKKASGWRPGEGIREFLTEWIGVADEWERHPSFGLVSICRVQSTGRALFESPFRHQHFITLSISKATRRRTDLHDNHVMAD
jgi:hypothetical protein